MKFQLNIRKKVSKIGEWKLGIKKNGKWSYIIVNLEMISVPAIIKDENVEKISMERVKE